MELREAALPGSRPWASFHPGVSQAGTCPTPGWPTESRGVHLRIEDKIRNREVSFTVDLGGFTSHGYPLLVFSLYNLKGPRVANSPLKAGQPGYSEEGVPRVDREFILTWPH